MSTLTSNERKCYGCEHSIPWDWVFCAWCGWENDKPGAEKGPPAHETPEQRCPAGGSHESDHYICTKCGLKTPKFGHAKKAGELIS